MGHATPIAVPVFLGIAGRIYRFLLVEFHHANDGSFYIFVDREETVGREALVSRFGVETREPVSRAFKLSYHTSGQVNFEGPKYPTIFCEPLYEVRSAQLLLYQQIPSAAGLSLVDEQVDPMNVIALPEGQAVGIEIWLVPFEPWEPTQDTLFACAMGDLFRLHLVRTLPAFTEERLVDQFVRAIPSAGSRPNQTVSKADAAVNFHTRISRSNGSVLALGSGRYRYYFRRAMLRRPKVTTVAFCSGVTCHIEHVEPYFLQFRLSMDGESVDTDDPLGLVGFKLRAEL